MMFETGRGDNPLMPLKRGSFGVVGSDESIDRLPYLAGRSEAGPLQRLPPEYAKPAFDLVKPNTVHLNYPDSWFHIGSRCFVRSGSDMVVAHFAFYAPWVLPAPA